MAYKLETKNVAPCASSVLEIISSGSIASVVLAIEEINERIEVNGKVEFQTSKLKRKQILTFIGADGSPCSLEGAVLEADAVEIAAAHKVVVACQIANELKAAYEKGRVSKGYTSLELVQVLEVWDTPKSCLWRASGGIGKAAVREFDSSTGKIS